jgi:tRNA (cmo5U34)-methyltransferase
MRAAVEALGRRFAGRGGRVLDVGCSRGDALAPFVDAGCDCVGLEVSEPMLAAAAARFGDRARVRSWDLRLGLPPGEEGRYDLVLAVLTVQFVPIEHRQRLVWDCHDRLRPGGALILVEKVLGATARLDSMMVDAYLARKAEQGYTAEQIERKRLALEGVLVPVTARWNEDLLAAAGFAEVDCFWRWMNFAGWVAIRAGQRR